MSKFNFFRNLVFSLTYSAFADTIRLKDGSIIKGKIINFNGGRFTVVVGDDNKQRQINFTAEEIESIVFDSRAVYLHQAVRQLKFLPPQ